MRLSGCLVEIELSWSRDKLTLNKERNWAFIGVGSRFKICFRSNHVAEHHMFSFFEGWCRVQIVLGSTHIVQ